MQLLNTDADAPVKEFPTPMEPEAVQFGWMKSTVWDGKTHLMTVVTMVGVIIPATTAKTSQLNVYLP